MVTLRLLLALIVCINVGYLLLRLNAECGSRSVVASNMVCTLSCIVYVRSPSPITHSRIVVS